MARADIYQQRLTELGWNISRLTEEIVRLRKDRGEDITSQQIYSSIRNCLKKPERSTTYINDDIINAMGGENIIRWKTTVEIKV